MKLLWVVAAFVGLVIVGVACVQSLAGPLNVDFTMFWRADELAYPPPYLLLVRCLGLLPYGAAFVIWVGLTCALYLARAPAPKPVALANRLRASGSIAPWISGADSLMQSLARP